MSDRRSYLRAHHPLNTNSVGEQKADNRTQNKTLKEKQLLKLLSLVLIIKSCLLSFVFKINTVEILYLFIVCFFFNKINFNKNFL